MLPIVQTKTGPGKDGRKGKELFWREARLCFARPRSRWTGFTGRPSGRSWLRACSGTKWPREPAWVRTVPGCTAWVTARPGSSIPSKSSLARAKTHQRPTPSIFIMLAIILPRPVNAIAPERNKDWLHEQQELLLQNKKSEPSAPHLGTSSGAGTTGRSADTKCAWLHERTPAVYGLRWCPSRRPAIGSGEVEGGHRHVLQKRLKIAGAWWLERNAERMLQLRTVRANGDWDKYLVEVAKN